ncbi:hypothetical protein [Deminuibacter soli]|uniref:Uncharacterized protein n=1 Tax=Deminuibacter soli TaxID=2291815 RepID=A0A3E1NCM8_9BACT|nr:hypothetical protein [Deminuibacter soli]RFM25713.1 hypothetical protein DXN05_23675 [Deminuibacter soli]
MREWNITCDLNYIDQHGRKQIIHVSGCAVPAASASDEYPPIDSLYVIYWANDPFSANSTHRPTFNSFLTKDSGDWQIGYILHRNFTPQKSHFFDWLKDEIIALYEREMVINEEVLQGLM